MEGSTEVQGTCKLDTRDVVGDQGSKDWTRDCSEISFPDYATSSLKCRGDRTVGFNMPSDTTEPPRPAVRAMVGLPLVSTSPSEVTETMFEKLKKEHDLAKAVKANDAKVPVYLWDEAECKGKPSEREAKTLTVLQSFLLGQYRWHLWRDIQSYMSKKFGQNWVA
jgi:hypothetical protein